MNADVRHGATQQTKTKPDEPLADQAANAAIDITAEVCPMTFVRTRLALDRLAPGQTLLVTLRGAEPLRNVPRTAREQGHEVLSLETTPDGVSRLLLRRGA
jgi:TusA-related sulfurtransferase